MQILIAACCVFAVGLFLNVRGMIRLLKNQEKKLFFWALGFFIVAPVLIILLYNLFSDGVVEPIWVYFPLLIFFVAWACEGFFIQAYLKKEMQRKLDGAKKIVPIRPKHHIAKNSALIATSVGIWVVGVFVGFPSSILSTCALCICVYLFIRAVASLWRYRGF